MPRKVAVVLIVLAYALLLRGPLLGLLHPQAQAQHGSAGMPGMDARAATPSDPGLAAAMSALALTGIMLALVPLRKGEAWALWTVAATWLIIGVARLATDPRCLVVLDPNQHGCHTFMAALVLALVGFVLAAFAGRATSAAKP